MAKKQAGQHHIGPFNGRYHPDYALKFWHDGDPRQPVKNVNLRSVTAIQTSKSLDDISGTFTITLKDGKARQRIREMDTVRIMLRGHGYDGYSTVLKGVVDTARQGGSGDVYASREDSVIEGRCMAKYLQVTSLFLPVWDPQGALPTALLFGLGDASKKVKSTNPYDIFEYLLLNYTFGKRNMAGISGVPNSRFWLDYKSRFDKLNFVVPFVQFDEDAMSDALKRLEVTGFSEAWVDELGHVVYRHPQWDAPATFLCPTSSLSEWDFPRSDVGVATYVEVIPAGDPGIDSAQAQALRAGRAPVPSSYLAGQAASSPQTTAPGTKGTTPQTSTPPSQQMHVSPEFIIQTDAKGKVTAQGAKNSWYKRQRYLGLRPQQITSPLLATQEQAQAQAEGLLQFYGRMIKTAQCTIPGYPALRLGHNMRIWGELDGTNIDRTFYIDQISHEYVETVDGGSYTTSFRGSHGRDPWDPKWGAIAIPKFDPAQLAQRPGILSPGATGGSGGSGGSVGGRTTSHGAFVGGIYARRSNWRGQDQGVDFAGAGPMPAFAAGRITHVQATNSGWPRHTDPPNDGLGALICQSLDTPVRGVSGAVYHHIYYAENITPAVSVGQRVSPGDVIAHAAGVFAYTEQGFAADSGGTTAARASGQGRNFRGGAGHDFQVWIGY